MAFYCNARLLDKATKVFDNNISEHDKTKLIYWLGSQGYFGTILSYDKSKEGLFLWNFPFYDETCTKEYLGGFLS